jgi:hypothetical protein
MSLKLSARTVANLLAHVFGPSYYDGPRFGGGDPGRRGLIDFVSGPTPEPWRTAALNPQPLPPKTLHALVLADAHIQELLTFSRIGALMKGEVEGHAQQQALRIIAEIDELCPRWPHWPKVWPPPPPPPWQLEQMSPTELFVFGSRFLAASELMEPGKLQDALSRLGEKALDLSMQR